MSVVKSGNATAAPLASVVLTRSFDLPPGFVATRLAAELRRSQRALCYIALDENQTAEVAEAVSALCPEVEHIVLPPWDCLPYDRMPPSRHCMGRRMDALRIWNTPGGAPKLLLTSLDVMLQRIPPAQVVADSQLELVVGRSFNRKTFFDFMQRTGYSEEGVADDPGEVAVREGVIDIYPAGAPGPMRIVVSADDRIEELRGFDRISQRTESYLDRVIFGPASEAILSENVTEDLTPKTDTMERLLLCLYEAMPSVFDILGDAAVHLAPGATGRVERHLEIIDDARQIREDFDKTDGWSSRSLYLTGNQWHQHTRNCSTDLLNLEEVDNVPIDVFDGNRRSTLVKFIQDRLQQGQKIVLCGTGKAAEALSRRAAKAAGMSPLTVDCWEAALKTKPGTLLRFACPLSQGFIDIAANMALITVADGTSLAGNSIQFLTEPELRIGDVVVHEDHGIGVLENLESVVIEGVTRDAARLQYRDGASMLIPMEEFGKIWRYGSEPEAVTLDRLHTDAWRKKREKIAIDIQSTARHLLKVAKKRQTSAAGKFSPPRAEFASFERRFPYAETHDQAEAIKAVLSDLTSERAMNRIVCGDVGFGKTEIALRAAAAVALAGGQVVIIVPTTVLARQHYATFERRFAGTGISVGMLSRLVKPNEAKQVKAALEAGEIGVIVATQAILAKDVRFANLALLIVDEEHRFGLKEKRAMADLAPSLHTLTMSATPIPRTLQSAMVGIQEVSLLMTPPSRRLPVRTSIATFDNASIRTGLMREYRRGGQSFVVVPRIEDIDRVETILRKIVPELSIKVAHGKMPAASIDEAVVGFAEGDGDVLLATNIIENGLDVPRANTMFIWHADRFGLAQLHQLRGRVGRGGTQGTATLLTEEEAELAEETWLRLSTLVENDRLGAGLAISLRDLDLRGGGDIAGEDQAGHMKAVGTGLYQKLLAGAVAKLRMQPSATHPRAILNIGLTRTIPGDYVSDPAVRLNLYAKLMRASEPNEMDGLEEEFEDRFGELPKDVLLLLRTTRLQLLAGQLGLAKLEAGPKATAMTLTAKTPAKVIAALKKAGAVQRGNRFLFETSNQTGEEQLQFFEQTLSAASYRKEIAR